MNRFPWRSVRPSRLALGAGLLTAAGCAVAMTGGQPVPPDHAVIAYWSDLTEFDGAEPARSTMGTGSWRILPGCHEAEGMRSSVERGFDGSISGFSAEFRRVSFIAQPRHRYEFRMAEELRVWDVTANAWAEEVSECPARNTDRLPAGHL
ncbi:MAG TPA: hypothetical protein VMN39_10020 [Longimicrobiaceae bacterium]|nr:hypothetical protein [Longimicrobiaceae bacterium]